MPAILHNAAKQRLAVAALARDVILRQMCIVDIVPLMRSSEAAATMRACL